MLNGNIPIGAVEIEPYCRKVLIQRQLDGCLPLFPIWDDVCTFRADNPECSGFIEWLRSIRDELRICGGFPCQDLSYAGNKKGIDGERSGLFFELARIVDEIRPREFLLENSPNILVLGLDRVLSRIAEMGYNAQWGIISAGDMGFGTERKRWWLLGHREGVLSVDGVQERLHNEFKIRIGQTCAALGSYTPERLVADALAVRTLDGVSGWMEQFKAVGNSQVPRVASTAEVILRGINLGDAK